jgi:hypothetical protein
MSDIEWTNERRKLKDLIPWKINPRQIREKQARRLAQSLEEFNQIETIAVGPNGELYNGHQRLNVWGKEYGGDLEVDVRVSSRPLTEQERKKLTIYLHKGAAGEWDFDLLANNFELDELEDWGFEPKELDIFGFGEETEEEEIDDKYTMNVKAPIYEIKGEKPMVSELYDKSRTEQLLNDIEGADIPEDVKTFLRVAANRHTRINYKAVAEFYAHSDKETQKLIEDSALIIIDFDKAIELGYVELSEKVAEQYRNDFPYSR